jgi:hypothetical protein
MAEAANASASNPHVAMAVLTTIQPPTSSVVALAQSCCRMGMRVLAVGDRKSPAAEWPRPIDFVPLDAQKRMNSRLASLVPTDHYARKNLGYLEAFARGATVVFDTDDDNAPLDTWRLRPLRTEGRRISKKGWVNVYRLFSNDFIWPRGFPIESLQDAQRDELKFDSVAEMSSPIQQGLVQGSPDVDAVWRLLYERDFAFDERPSVWLDSGSWCPFNSQSTWWFEKAFPLMYLPSFVNFRVTDIWRSFVAQRCLWQLGYGVVFHGPESVQDRNLHNNFRDFQDEIPGYLNNARIISILERLELYKGIDKAGENLYLCYEALISADIVPAQKIPLLEAWLADIAMCKHLGSLFA